MAFTFKILNMKHKEMFSYYIVVDCCQCYDENKQRIDLVS